MKKRKKSSYEKNNEKFNNFTPGRKARGKCFFERWIVDRIELSTWSNLEGYENKYKNQYNCFDDGKYNENCAQG